MPISRAILNAALEAPTLGQSKFKGGKTVSIEQIDALCVAARAWDEVKRFIAEREKYRCRVCGKKCRYGDPIATRADAHHIIFASAGGPDESWNLVHLCRGCHDLIHKLKKLFLSGNADALDEMGRGMVKVERPVEGGFEVVGFM